MRQGALTLVLLVSLGCSLSGAQLVHMQPEAAAAFADLISKVFLDATGSFELMALTQAKPDTYSYLVGLNRETIFYGLLSVCATMLTLGTCSSILSIIHREHLIRRLGTFRRVSGGGRQVADDRGIQERLFRWPWAQAILNRVSVRAGGKSEHASVIENFVITALWRLAALRFGLVGKLIFIFTSAIVVFGVITIALVQVMLLPTLTQQAIDRAKVTARSIAAVATIPPSKKNVVGVSNALLRIKASSASVAYILVENGAGMVSAHSLDSLPKQLSHPQASKGYANSAVSVIKLGDASVYEVKLAAGEKKLNFVRVGVWKSAIDAELGRIVAPIVKFVALVVIAEIVFAVLLIWRLTRPISRLVGSARRISIGDLDVSTPGFEENNGIGELSRAFERMRSSVKAAIARL